MDGIDVAVCRLAAGQPRLVELLGARTVPWDPGLAARLRGADAADALELARLNRLTGEAFADAAAELARELSVSLDLVGSHGQTVAHEHGVATLQIGEAAVLAERLGCPVVAISGRTTSLPAAAARPWCRWSTAGCCRGRAWAS